jgi:FkbM family methyltransferase
MRKSVKSLLKAPFRACGFDVVRLRDNSSEFLFQPSEANQFSWLQALDINTVIDIGAHHGEFARKILAILPHASVVSFEPQEVAFAQLTRNMAGIPNFHAYHCALGDEEGRMIFHVNEFSPSSSLLSMTSLHKTAFPFTAGETSASVDVRRLDDVVGTLDLDDQILIKIDVQGYEEKVIVGGQQLISRSRLLIVETSFQPLYEGQAFFDQIYSLLRNKGFQLCGVLEQLRSPVNGIPLQADMMFIRP